MGWTNRGFNPRRSKNLSHHPNVNTDSVVHPSSYKIALMWEGTALTKYGAGSSEHLYVQGVNKV
jgi:hypothetical protein